MQKPIERPTLINTYARSFEPLKNRNLRIYLGG